MYKYLFMKSTDIVGKSEETFTSWVVKSHSSTAGNCHTYAVWMPHGHTYCNTYPENRQKNDMFYYHYQCIDIVIARKMVFEFFSNAKIICFEKNKEKL